MSLKHIFNLAGSTWYKAIVVDRSLFLLGAAHTNSSVDRWDGSHYRRYYGLMDIVHEFHLTESKWRSFKTLLLKKSSFALTGFFPNT